MNHAEKLFKEYELCQDTVRRTESTIWKTSAAIGIGSLGPLILFATQKEKPDWQTTFIIGILVFSAALTWWFIARRWWDVQHATLLRMRHIEEELHLYAVRYVHHKDKKLQLVPDGFYLTKEHIQELNGIGDTKSHLRGVQDWLKLFPFFLLISWLEYGSHRYIESDSLFNMQSLRDHIIYLTVMALPFLALIGWNAIHIRRRVKKTLRMEDKMINLIAFFKHFFSFLASAGWIIISLFVGILILGGFLTIIEKNSIGDSIYLAFITALTIGYGDITPSTALGKIICIILGMIGIIFMGVIVAASIRALEESSQKGG